jgi:hypothetical protein
MAMHLESDDLDLRFCTIRENLDSLKESIASGSLRDAMRHAAQLNYSTGKLAAELVGNPIPR